MFISGLVLTFNLHIQMAAHLRVLHLEQIW
jgi:hypothetical protein